MILTFYTMKLKYSVIIEFGRFTVCCERIREKWTIDSVIISFFTNLSGGRWRLENAIEGPVFSIL